MLEYFYKYRRKDFKKLVKDLVEELEKIASYEGVDIEMDKRCIVADKYSGVIEISVLDRLNIVAGSIKCYRKDIYNRFFKKDRINSNHAPSVIDLFAGAGGLSCGLENAGFKPVFVNEIDPVFCETYYFNRDLSANNYYVGDIKELVKEGSKYDDFFQNIDLVCGGPPCQGFSMANRQPLVNDPRNILYRYYLEFLHKVRPKFFIIENVKGMSKKIDEIITDCHSIVGEEYNIHYTLLNAKDFGLPQNRERFFIIGNRVGVNSKRIIDNIISNKPERKFVLKDAIGDLPILQAKTEKNNCKIENSKIGFVLQPHKYKETEYRNYINRRNIPYIFNHKNRYNNKRDVEIFSRLPQGANSLHESIKDIMPYVSRNHIFKDKYFKLNETQVCKTITSHMKFDCNMYIHPNQPRGLSPREAARVQTFPDDYYFRGAHNKCYAQIGNAVPVKLAEIIGQEIIKYIK